MPCIHVHILHATLSSGIPVSVSGITFDSLVLSCFLCTPALSKVGVGEWGYPMENHKKELHNCLLFYTMVTITKKIQWPTQAMELKIGRVGVISSSIQELSCFLIGRIFSGWCQIKTVPDWFKLKYI